MSLPQAHYIVDADGNKTAVILSIEQYEQLLENLHDLAVVVERRDEHPTSLKDMKRHLNQS